MLLPGRLYLALLLGLCVAWTGTSASEVQRPDSTGRTIVDYQRWNLRLWAPGADCDSNGVSDSLDIAQGFGDDLNDNGILDICDPQLGIELVDAMSRWRRHSEARDTSYFWSAFMPEGSVLIRYTVPRGGARVRLRILNAAGRIMRTLVDCKQPSGGIELSWDRADFAGTRLPAGVYAIRLSVNKRIYVRHVHWSAEAIRER